MADWTPEDIPWHEFDPSRVDPELLKLVKAASLVEYNSGDYTAYLCNVFHDDPRFQKAVRNWEGEEVQHGRVLARWAKLADPAFDFDASFRVFLEGFRLPLEATDSVRGSRTGELIARCIVEVGTSSYYSALGGGTEEPVLREICRRIASDEFRHYKMFYDHMKRYVDRDRVGFWRRIWVALGRIGESEDDELAYAYYTTNHAGQGPYDRKRYINAYMIRAYLFYRPGHLQRAIAMILKAVGIRPGDRVLSMMSRALYAFLRVRRVQMARASA